MIAYLFPGQGSQKVGMYNLLGDKVNEVEEIFEIAREASGRNIVSLCKELTDEELRMTNNTQMCVTAMNMAYFKILANRGIVPDVVAGHSLGQLSALAAAEVISLYDLFRIVEKRSELMMRLKQNGKLATIIGLDKEIIENICNEVSKNFGKVSIALENSNRQYVIGGEERNVDYAIEIIKTQDFLKIIELKVSNAFHTYLMEPIVKPFGAFVDKIVFKEPKAKVLLNVKGDFAESVEEIKRDLVDQCVNVVKWEKCMSKLTKTKNVLIAEVGVGKTMSSLLKGISREHRVYSISNNTDLDLFLKILKK